jgi:membrane protease YdiL (CAAX protease family)
MIRRFLNYWLVRFLILFVAMAALDAAAQIVPSELARLTPAIDKPLIILGCVIVAIPIMLGAYALLVRLLERRSASEVAFAPGQLVAGVVIGVLLFTSVIAILGATGHATIALPAALIFPTLGLAISLVSGVAEELMFRGAMFRVIEERFGTMVGMVVSAAFFGGVHIFNPGATLISSAAIAVEAGLLLALAYTATRSLWLPIGLHFAWNFTEGGIFTTEVSGGKVPGILDTTLTGPELLTGGKFGPEASVVAVGACLVVALVFLIVTLRRGQWRKFGSGAQTSSQGTR